MFALKIADYVFESGERQVVRTSQVVWRGDSAKSGRDFIVNQKLHRSHAIG